MNIKDFLNKPNIKLLFFSLMLIILISCNNSLTPESITKEENSETNGIVLSFPRYSSAVKNALSRAFIAADIINYEITNTSTSEIVKSGILSDDYGDNSAADTNTLQTSILLDPGTYTIYIEVFNTDNSEEEAVVSGTSTEFEVTGIVSDTPTVYVYLMPTSSETLEESTTYTMKDSDFATISLSQLISYDDYYGDDYYDDYYDSYEISIGNEKWYSFTASSDSTVIQFDYDIDYYTSTFVFFLYDATGAHLDTISLEESTIIEDISTEIGKTYYLGVIYYENGIDSGGNVLDDVDITIYPYSGDADTNTDIATSESIVIGDTIVSDFNDYDDLDYYELSVIAGNYYNIEFSSYNVSSYIYDVDGNVLATSYYENSVGYYAQESKDVYIAISSEYDSGSAIIYGIKAQEVAELVTSSQSIDETVEDEINSTTPNVYTYDLLAGESYYLIWNDYSISDDYDGSIMVSVYKDDGTVYYNNITYMAYESLVFTPEVDESITVIISKYDYYGTYSFNVNKMTELGTTTTDFDLYYNQVIYFSLPSDSGYFMTFDDSSYISVNTYNSSFEALSSYSTYSNDTYHSDSEISYIGVQSNNSYMTNSVSLSYYDMIPSAGTTTLSVAQDETLHYAFYTYSSSIYSFEIITELAEVGITITAGDSIYYGSEDYSSDSINGTDGYFYIDIVGVGDTANEFDLTITESY